MKGLTILAISIFVSGICSFAETPVPKTSVQIVNATSVPRIGLRVNGDEKYPDFPQGLYTADAPIPVLKAKYVATEKSSGRSAERDWSFEPNRNQSLVILGDFSVDQPPDKLPQVQAPPPKPDGTPYPPNVQMRVYSHEEHPENGIKYRIINGMPRKVMKLSLQGKFLAELQPGDEFSLTQQAPLVDYSVEVDSKVIAVRMRQEGLVRNAMIIFFLQEDGTPAFLRAFENTTQSRLRASEAETEAKED
jgi:hypothetical protein